MRTVLSAVSTLTAIRASVASALPGNPITLTATVSDFPRGGATPNGGTLTFGDQYGSIATVPLINGVATLTTSSLAAGTYTFNAFYGGNANFGPSATGTIVTAASYGTSSNLAKAETVGKVTPDAPKIASPDALGVVTDSAGDLFIADQPNNVVREIIKATGQNIIVAGNGTAGYSGDNGPATAAELNSPLGLAVDSAGNLFIGDTGNNVIREVVKETGNIITFAGNGTAGYSGDNGPATHAALQDLTGIAVDSKGDLFIADGLDDVIREVDRSNGNIITTIVGTGWQGSTGYNGQAYEATLEIPADVAVDSAGNVFISDRGNNYILEVEEESDDIIVVAGKGSIFGGTAGYSGDGGPATAAELNAPIGVTVDSVGDLFIADGNNSVVREVVKATGDIITVAGNGQPGDCGDGGPATAAELDGLTGVAIDSAGNLYIADGTNDVARETTPAVVVAIRPDATLTALRSSAASMPLGRSVTFAATVSDLTTIGTTPIGGAVTFNDQSGTIASEPLINGVATVTTSSLALGAHTVTASYGGSLDFAPSTTGTIITFAGTGLYGYEGDNGPASRAELEWPADVAVDSAGNLFIADITGDVVREVVRATGNIITVAGNGNEGDGGDNGPATTAELDFPASVAVDSAGDLFIAESNIFNYPGTNNVIREVVKATGKIITVAGNGTAGYSGDNGPANSAELNNPDGVAVDSVGDLFIADGDNSVVREVVKATGDIITVAGNGTAGYTGDYGPATSAELNYPAAVAVDSVGDLFIADGNNHVVREVVKATGDIITVAGNGTDGYSGDTGPATAAELNSPSGVAVDSVGDLFIADGNNHVVREVVKATGDIITVAGNGTDGYSGDTGPATAAELNSPSGVAVNSTGNLFISDSNTSVVRQVTLPVTIAITRPPQVVSERLLTVKVVTHKGKRVITSSKFGGFQLRFNEALNPAPAQNTANYHLTETFKKGRKTIEEPVSFNVTYIASTHTVDVEISGKVPPFTKGGLLTLTAPGFTDLAGDTLVGPTAFKILAYAKGIKVLAR